MQHGKTHTRAVVVALIVAAIGAACSGDGPSLPTSAKTSAGSGTGGDTSNTTTPTPTPTSNRPVATVVVSPQQLSLTVGHYGQVSATPRDAQGVIVAGKRATWSSSNAAIVVVSDTGVIYAKATGTAKVYGTIDGYKDSATVVVAAAPTVVDTVRTTPPDSNRVASFNLTLDVQGALPGSDTTKTQPLAGVTVTVTRIMGIKGDSLNPGIVAATLTTDANGAASAKDLPGGFYQFIATPAAGSGYLKSSFGIGAPTMAEVKVRFTLLRAP